MRDNKFPPLKNDCIIKAARGEDVPYLPVWIMRQAGRYLPEFQAVRAEHDFFTVCRTPELCCEVTLQPINRFELDAAIIFSDILVIPQAVGMEVKMTPGVGPVFVKPLESVQQIDELNWSLEESTKELNYVYEAITLTRHRLNGKVPLIGFAGAPWTLMSYMIDGGSSHTYSKAKKWLYTEPLESKRLLNLLTSVVSQHLINQVLAGAQLLQVFESHAGVLPPDTFRSFALPCLESIANQVRDKLVNNHGFLPNDLPPMVVFAKDGHYCLSELAKCNYDVIGLDWSLCPKLARRVVGERKTLQGNLDPCALYAPKTELQRLVKDMLEKFGRSKYIVNLGHGIYPDVKPENVGNFVNIVHELSRE